MLPADIEWHFIGHLQRNKVKYIAPFVHLIHAVDGPELLDEIEKRAAAAGRTIGILVQVHIAQEETKHGMLADEVRALVTGWDVTRWPHVELHGLMGMATNTEDVAMVTRELAGLRALFDELSPDAVSRDIPFHTLSMGMSADAQLAVSAGSTLVRVGSALFGPRT
jgi:pyridoxal phosphate enzyme (YggS family)